MTHREGSGGSAGRTIFPRPRRWRPAREPPEPCLLAVQAELRRKSQVRAAGRGKPRCQSQPSRQVPGPQL